MKLGLLFCLLTGATFYDSCIGTPSLNHNSVTNKADTMQQSNTRSDTAEQEFVKLITQATIAKISEQDAALNNSKNEEVKTAAKSIKRVHTELNKELIEYASSHNISLPDAADASRQQILKDLLTKKGKAFDEDYTSHQVSGHTRLVEMFTEVLVR